MSSNDTLLKRYEKALKRIAVLHSCGCKPCVGQCHTIDAMHMTIYEMQQAAREALKGKT